ncbi:MAG TPA: peptidoglycan editing factor PgeF [Thermodesulfobacteriota bacterium]|nr:peptidoglycan editing factor PgeF [Thermodesulfobacteriota bacterium]
MGWIKSETLSELKGVSHGFSDRNADLSPGGIKEAFGFSRIARLNQVHGKDVFVLRDRPEAGEGRVSDADAIITSIGGIGIGVATADCVPILLTDVGGTVAGAVHAGWRGTVLRILDSVVEKINGEYGIEPSEIIAVIGPSVGMCCYEVREDVASHIREGFDDWDKHLVRKGGAEYMLDLPGINRGLLEKAGVKRIEIVGICTKCNADFYSYRREGKGVGSQLSVIGLAEGRTGK